MFNCMEALYEIEPVLKLQTYKPVERDELYLLTYSMKDLCHDNTLSVGIITMSAAKKQTNNNILFRNLSCYWFFIQYVIHKYSNF